MPTRTVHVLKPEFLDSGHAEDAVMIAQKTSGPLTYTLVDFDFDREPVVPDLAQSSQGLMADSVAHLEPPPEPSAFRKMLGRLNLSRMQNREPLEVPEPSEHAQDWILRLERAEQRYRYENDVPQDDVVLMLSTRGNHENFFVIPRFSGSLMAAIQVNHAVTLGVPSHVLVGYYLMALPVMLLAYKDEDMLSYLDKHAHRDVRGCLNDLCDEDVEQLLLKTKTGDICVECKRHFQGQNLDWDMVRQMRQGFDLVRAIQLNLEDFLEGFSKPAMTVGVRPQFEELGLTVPLSPKEMAVYVTFLEAGMEGISMNALDEHRPQLRDAYARRYNRSDVAEIDRVVDKLIDPMDPDLQQVLTKINRKFKSTLGEGRAEAYMVTGPRGEAKSIALPRHLIRRA